MDWQAAKEPVILRGNVISATMPGCINIRNSPIRTTRAA
jgi:hypothetical protein